VLIFGWLHQILNCNPKAPGRSHLIAAIDRADLDHLPALTTALETLAISDRNDAQAGT
jgi:hypothetical protein